MWARRGLVFLTTVVVGGALAVLLAVHTPWARSRALTWATDFVTRYQLTLKAADLRYNAITRRITLTGVRLAAVGHDDRPFLLAQRIEVRLPWIVYRGRFEIDHLEIEAGLVDIYRDANDIVNLPPGATGPAPDTPRRLTVHGLTLRGLDVQYADQMRDWSLQVPRIETALVKTALGSEGAFAIRGETAVRIRERTMTLSPIETVMTFDGSNVSLKDARLVSSEINAFMSGPIRRVLDSPSFDLAIRGVVNLEHATRWVPPPPVPVGGTVAIDGKLTGPFRAFTLALGTTSTDLSIGRERNVRMVGPVTVTLDATVGSDMTLVPHSGGEIRAAFKVPWGPSPPSTARAAWKGLDAQAALRLGDFDPQAIGAAFDGHGTFEFGEPRRYEATNRATPRAGRGVVPVGGTLDATLVGDDYRIEHAHRVDGLVFEGTTSGRYHREVPPLTTLVGPAHATVVDGAGAAASLEALGIPMPEISHEIHGALDVPMTLSGSFRSPAVEATLSGEAVDVPLVGVVRAAAGVSADTRTATISNIDIRRGSATVTGTAVGDITTRTWSGDLRLDAPRALDLQDSVTEGWRLDGPVTATATLGGTFDAFRLDSVINGSAFTWADQSYDRFTARAVVTPYDVDVTSLLVEQGVGTLDGGVTYAWDTGAYKASLKGRTLSWQGTLLTPNDTDAVFSVDFDGEGTTARPRGQARVDFVLSGSAAGAVIDAGELTVDLLGDQARVSARLPALGATLNGDIATASPYDYRATVVLDRLDLARLVPLTNAIEGQVLGFVSGNVTASGRLADARDRVAVFDLQTVDAGIGGVPVRLNLPARISLRGDDVTLRDLDMRVGVGRLTASGDWNTRLDGKFRGTFAGEFQDALRLGKAFGVPMTVEGTGPMSIQLESTGNRAGTVATLGIKGGTFSWGAGPAAVRNLNIDAALNGESLTVSRISGDVAVGGVVGAFSASARARLPTLELAAVDGQLIVDAARFTFSGIPVAQQRPSRFQFAKGAVTATDVVWSVADNPLTLSGSVGFAATDPPLDLSVKGLVDLRVLSAFVSTIAFDGNADFDARIGGVMSKPSLGGQIGLVDAEIALAEPRLVLSELTGPITLLGQTILIENVRGEANGGQIALDGAFRFEGLSILGGALNVQAKGVALELPKGLRSEVDALIIYRPDPKVPSVTGDVRIVQSAYTETITIASLARRATLPVAPMVQRPYLDRLRLNLAITTTDDIVVDNNYGRLEANADVRIVGTVAEPGVDGRITLGEGGEIFLAGRTFRITRGDISFTDLRRIHPEFNIAAEARLGGDDVTMTLTGTLERPQLDLTSQAGSRTPGELASQIVGTSNADAALTLLSADLLGVTGRAIGLDAFRLERGDYIDRDFRERDFQEDPALLGNNQLDPTTRLTISKRLSDQVEVTVSQNLRESGKTTFVISYLPRHNVEVRALSRDNASVSLGIRHQVTLGSGSATRPIERRVRPTVTEVRFAAADPLIEQEARRHLRLGPGDQFDFLVLQRDIDRIREAFHGQGFQEARVRTRRVEDKEANTVAVEFRIDRGPRTILQVTGTTLPPGELKALEDAWYRNTFDQFLIDDLTGRVRRYLVTQNELVSVVVGTIDRPAPETKRLRIDVTPGASVDRREIRFDGNTGIGTSDLLDEVTAAGLEIEAWLDRAVLEREILTFYNEQGYLKARVTAGPIDIDGTTGVLPVTIVEGPRALVAGVKWAGVAEPRLTMVQEAAAIKPAAPFITTQINEARRRVEREYRERGFNQVEISVDPLVAADDTVTLTFNVNEGPQEVLQDIVTTGTEITRGYVIREALRFELGQPVDLDEWARARKRLYDTNVFRQVDIQAVTAGEVKDGVQPMTAQVSVVEYPAWSLRYGTQLESERQADIEEFTSSRNLGLVAEIKNPNLFGRALTMGVFGQYQRERQDATLFLATSRLFGWRARSSLFGFFSRDRIRNEEGTHVLAITDREGVSADQRWRLGGIQVVYGYRFEHNRTFDPTPSSLDPFPLDVVSNLARLSGAAVFDRRDDPLNARKGTFTSVSWDHAAYWLGSDVVNRKLLAQHHTFVPVGSRLVLASRVQSGFVFGPDELLESDRFRAGGATTVRGYGEDSLGPRSQIGIPTGGETLVILNHEARFPIYGWAHGVAFVDAGNIFGKDEPFSWRALRLGYGFGLRLDTPFGMLRADVGIPKTALSSTKTTRFHFGFGHVF